MQLSNLGWLATLCLGSIGLMADQASAQAEMQEHLSIVQTYDSGWVQNQGTEAEVIASYTVRVNGAAWMRLFFGAESHLGGDIFQGTNAYLVLTSHADGDVQMLNPIHLEQWQNSSAYFNGEAVQVDLVAHPGTGAHRIKVDSVDMSWGTHESQCGPVDDRVLSSDPRSGRLLPIGCTGWLINDCSGCSLTAGHCTGNISVLQFNVPLSNGGGGLNNPPASDQYAVDPASLISNGGQGVGNDWAYFGTFPNSNTGLTAAQAAGSTFILASPPAVAGNDIRITGFGTDNTPSTHNQVQQTHVGPMAVNNGTQLGYTTDTTGGNSGSPVIWEQTGEAIGIHTHGGCSTNTPPGSNSGTSYDHPALQNALANPQGICESGGINVVGPIADFVAPTVPVTVQLDVMGGVVPGSVLVFHRQGTGAFQSITMTAGAGTIYQATLPGPTCGDPLEYYFTADTTSCGLVFSPIAGAAAPYSSEVGTVVATIADDFNTNMGWTAENLGASTGDWQRGVPVDDGSWAYDPSSDSDGSGQCYMTQNQNGNTDVDNGSVRLNSPSFQLNAESGVSFDYYLNMTNTNGDDRLLVEMSSNGAAGPWMIVATLTDSNGSDWTNLTLDPSDWMGAGLTPSADARIRFTANDSGTQSIVEAGIDAFSVREVDCGGPGTTFEFCDPANPNISGFPTVMSANFGSGIGSDLHLEANLGPQGQFGFFLVGDGFVDPGTVVSNGRLCLDSNGMIGRYNIVGGNLNSIGQFDGNGTLQNIVGTSTTGTGFDVPMALPFTGSPMIQAGETWYFQLWHRDGSGEANFSNGIGATF